ncbi:DUF3010 domain-containing protein [Hydrogenovibrio sp. SC-1]|uniref:DUF3010 family protein n=1 Tax=Hydrogenovibrio sp. SC-1 TaxID=2065820 RepID=UPI000C7E73F1|nr:DUF3010 family protein [Hydrogenovibrio sp. SC-1]PLA75135.1 DUF3010 domain-containing protein [Hydrogenovibrio sp. SC-1]
MMICGVELSGNDAIISLVHFDADIFNLPDCRVRKISCINPDSAHELQYFQKTFTKLIEDYQVDEVVIRARQKKGKFAGGANGFKLEAALQLLTPIKVRLIDASTQKAALKKYPLPISFNETGLKKFQEPAFIAAFAVIAEQHEW